MNPVLTQILNLLILFGALQGFIVGTVLWCTKNNRVSNRLLSWLLWIISLASLNLYLDGTGWYYSSTTVNLLHSIFPTELAMAVGPLVYFYTKSWLVSNFSLPRSARLHFLPLALDLFPQLIALVFIVSVLLRLVEPNAGPWGAAIDTYYVYIDIPRWLSITTYVLLSLRILKQHTNTPHARWLRQFLTVFLVFCSIWLVYLVPYIIPKTRYKLLDTFSWYPVYIPLAILVYVLGIKGLLFSYTTRTSTRINRELKQVPQTEVDRMLDLILKAMENDRAYLDPTLNLEKLSTLTAIPARKISVLINTHFKQTFTEYVNGYRVEECKRRLMDSGTQNLTFVGIALECGFSSQATFQRVFRQVTGLSPSEFIQNTAQNTI